MDKITIDPKIISICKAVVSIEAGKLQVHVSLSKYNPKDQEKHIRAVCLAGGIEYDKIELVKIIKVAE